MNSAVDHRIDIDSELQQALRFHKAGQLDRAEDLYCRILEIQPGHADALHLLGLIHSEKGSLRHAKDFVQRAIQNDESVAVFYVSLGDILQREKNFAKAVKYYRRALDLNPVLVEAWCNMGNALRAQGLGQEAIACYKKCLATIPELPEVHNNMGLAYQQLKKFDSAIACFIKSISLNPDYAEAYNNLGNTYRDVSEFEAAIEHYQKALTMAPANTTINYNLGILFQSQKLVDQAVDCYQKAVEGHPPVPDAYNNLGKYYQDQNQPDRAICHFQTAVELDPEHFDAHFSRALCLLATGRFEEGWQAYEWRFKRDQWKRVYPHRLQGHVWDGRGFRGKTLFVHSEQGFGDTIWFTRFLPQIKALGGTVIFEVREELLELLHDFPAVDQVIPMSFDHAPQIAYDYYLPLMSTPRVLGTTLETIPANVPYLSASRTKREYWAARLQGSVTKIGLVWSAKSTNDHGRSCPLDKFLPLCSLENVRVYGLQKGEDGFQVNNLPADIINIGLDFETFADTAGAIECLDLVISVDTAVAHLAGAMGKPVWLLLPFAADWKWLMDRPDSPWYPTMRLFRQPRPGDWDSIINMVAAEIPKIISPP